MPAINLRAATFAVFVALGASACSAADLMTGRARPTSAFIIPHRSVTAVIDGRAFKSDWVLVSPLTGDSFGFLASMNGGSADLMAIDMTFPMKGTGRYTYPTTKRVPRASVSIGAREINWTTGGEGASGEVVVATMTSSRVSGTFQFTGVPPSWETARLPRARTVTKGRFAIEF